MSVLGSLVSMCVCVCVRVCVCVCVCANTAVPPSSQISALSSFASRPACSGRGLCHDAVGSSEKTAGDWSAGPCSGGPCSGPTLGSLGSLVLWFSGSSPVKVQTDGQTDRQTDRGREERNNG